MRYARAVIALCFSVSMPLAIAYQTGDSYIPVPLSMAANDVAYDAVGRRLVVATTAGATDGLASSLVIVNPETGAIQYSIPLGGEPGVLGMADNGRHVYVGLVGSPLVRRVDLNTRTVDLEASLGTESGFSSYPWSAESIAVAPGNSSRFAVSRKYSGLSPRHAGVALFDGATQRTTTTPGHTGSNLIGFDTDPAVLYGLNNETTEFGFRTMSVSTAGLVVMSTRTVNVGFGTSFALAGGRAYFTSGSIFDLARGIEIGRLDQPGVPAPHPSEGIVAVVGSQGSSLFSGPYELRIYDIDRFVLRDRVSLPEVKSSPVKLVRMGNDGFALLTQRDFSSSTSAPGVTLLVFDSALRPALSNASTRGVVGAGEDVMIAGFVIQGNAPRAMLVRVLGPTLTSFGVPGVLADPTVELYFGNTKVAENDDWRSAGADALAQLSRLQITPGFDRESVILRDLAPGAYSAVVRAKAGQSGGVALVEAYDVQAYGGDFSVGSAKTINLSTRARVGIGGDVLITGFVIGGNLPRRVLLNGIGSSLAAFGVTGALGNPKLELFQGTRKITEIDDWIDSTQFDELVNTGNSPRDPTEPALLLTLNPGAYSAVISGVSATQGVALAEVYDVRTLQDIKLARASVTNSFANLVYTQSGTPQSLTVSFLSGSTATLAGGPLGTFSYSVSGRNAATLSVNASNASISGTLKFFRTGVAQFRGSVSRVGQSSQQVTGTFSFE